MRRAWPRLLAVGLTLASPAALSCHSEPDPRLVRLDKRIRAEQLRLDGIVKQIEEAEGRATKAQSEAEYQSCRATTGELRAEIARRRAMCAKDVADHNLCLALNSKQAAESTIAGCAFGLLLGFFSGGTAAPWALGGCAVGAGTAPAPDCPSTECTDRLQELHAEVLTEHKLESFPRCGGYFGLSVRPLVAKMPTGIRIERVAPGTTAQSASLANGDTLWMVADHRVSSAVDVEEALSSIEPGELVEISVVRDSQWLKLTGTASRRDAAGELSERVQLGAAIGESLKDIAFEAGVQLAEVDAQGPASGTLRAGDAILEVSTESPAKEFRSARNPEGLEALLEVVRPGQRITFMVQRPPEKLNLEVQAAERGQHAWL
jgi:hypothetical protein